jgi:hypothetical protein
MTLRPQDSLSEEEREKGLGYVIKDGLSSQAMSTLTGGVFLVALALSLGASNKTIGLLASIPPFMTSFRYIHILCRENQEQEAPHDNILGYKQDIPPVHCYILRLLTSPCRTPYARGIYTLSHGIRRCIRL